MKHVQIYGQVRYAVQIEGLSKRAAARRFGIDPKTVAKMMSFSVPPGYVRTKPPVRPKLNPFIAIIDKSLADDKSRPKKKQHTSKRIFEQAPGRGRLHGWHHHREGLRGGLAAALARDVRAADASAGARAGRLRRGDRDHPHLHAWSLCDARQSDRGSGRWQYFWH